MEHTFAAVTSTNVASRATTTKKSRDRYLDTLRAIAIVRVVTFHAFGFAWFPWMPAMGVMFALGGTLMVRSVEKSPRQAVVSRFRRLLPVLWVFGAIWIPLMIWHDGAPSRWDTGESGHHPVWEVIFWILPLGDPTGSEWGTTGWGTLWYLKSYLWYVALSPLLLKAFRKAPWLVMTVPFGLLYVSLYGLVPLPGWIGSTFGSLMVYLTCWLIGFAHADGIIKRLPLPALFAIGGIVALAGIAWLLGPAREQNVADGHGVWFLEGSSMASALYASGVVLILMRFSSPMKWLNKRPTISRIITVLNSRAVTIYLWHNTALVIAMGVTDRFALYPWYFWYPLTWVLIAGFTLVLGWIEDVAAKRKPELLPGKPAVAVEPLSAEPNRGQAHRPGASFQPPQVPGPYPPRQLYPQAESSPPFFPGPRPVDQRREYLPSFPEAETWPNADADTWPNADAWPDHGYRTPDRAAGHPPRQYGGNDRPDELRWR